jgi:hypothetical protein
MARHVDDERAQRGAMGIRVLHDYQLLDLRARVRCRHTLSHQRGEWQQRIYSVLYHHGCP